MRWMRRLQHRRRRVRDALAAWPQLRLQTPRAQRAAAARLWTSPSPRRAARPLLTVCCASRRAATRTLRWPRRSQPAAWTNRAAAQHRARTMHGHPETHIAVRPHIGRCSPHRPLRRRRRCRPRPRPCRLPRRRRIRRCRRPSAEPWRPASWRAGSPPRASPSSQPAPRRRACAGAAAAASPCFPRAGPRRLTMSFCRTDAPISRLQTSCATSCASAAAARLGAAARRAV